MDADLAVVITVEPAAALLSQQVYPQREFFVQAAVDIARGPPAALGVDGHREATGIFETRPLGLPLPHKFAIAYGVAPWGRLTGRATFQSPETGRSNVLRRQESRRSGANADVLGRNCGASAGLPSVSTDRVTRPVSLKPARLVV